VSEAHLARNGGRVRNAVFTLKLELQSARALAGQTLAFDSLSDATTDEEAEFAAMSDAGLSNQVACYHAAKLRIAALGGDWRGALAWAERARALLPFFAGQPAEVVLVQYQGMAALAEAADGDEMGACLDEYFGIKSKIGRTSNAPGATVDEDHGRGIGPFGPIDIDLFDVCRPVGNPFRPADRG
jgi:hypothetical protein